MFYSRLGRVEKFKHGSKNFFILFSIYSFGVWMFAITYRVANTADFNSRGGTRSLSSLSLNWFKFLLSGLFWKNSLLRPSLRMKPVEMTIVTRSIELISSLPAWLFIDRKATLSIFAGTVMFLGKAVVLSVLILVLVQFIANTEVCYLHTQVRSRTFQTNWEVS